MLAPADVAARRSAGLVNVRTARDTCDVDIARDSTHSVKPTTSASSELSGDWGGGGGVGGGGISEADLVGSGGGGEGGVGGKAAGGGGREKAASAGYFEGLGSLPSATAAFVPELLPSGFPLPSVSSFLLCPHHVYIYIYIYIYIYR